MQDLLYQIGLTLVPNIGCVHAKILAEKYGSAERIFKASQKELIAMEGIGAVRANSIKSFADFSIAEEELRFIDQNKITPLFITDKKYPKRLLNCYDSPTLLYYKGEADLNSSRIVAIIGTRHHTEYGRHQTEKLISELSLYNIIVSSGLAFGIDAIAHKTSLKNNVPTIAVLAHGLDQVYPSQHTTMATEIIERGGGLLSEFRSKIIPDRHNFPTRNRIVAGMSDATIVIETGVRGGSMITAELANGYNRDVFAIPGKITDSKSAGCNYLIRNNKAILLTDTQELITMMNWDDQQYKSQRKKQTSLFIELDEQEKIIVNILREKQSAHIDELNFRSGLSSSTVASAVLTLELRNVIVSLPGKLYQLT
jgi:DNA processing protein